MRLRIAHAVALLALPLHLAAQEDVTYTMRTTTTASGMLAAMTASSPANRPRTARVQVHGDKLRMDFVDSLPSPFGLPGSTMLMLGDGRMVVVDAAQRTYTAIDPATIGGMAEQMKAAGIELQLVDPVVKVERIGAGEPMLGQATERWRMTQSFGLAMGPGLVIRSETITETTFGETPVGRGATTSMSDVLARSPFMSPDFVARMNAAAQELPARVPLRSTMTMVMRQGDQEMSRMTMTSDVLTLARGAIAADVFAIPAGYREVPFAVPNAMPREALR